MKMLKESKVRGPGNQPFPPQTRKIPSPAAVAVAPKDGEDQVPCRYGSEGGSVEQLVIANMQKPRDRLRRRQHSIMTFSPNFGLNPASHQSRSVNHSSPERAGPW